MKSMLVQSAPRMIRGAVLVFVLTLVLAAPALAGGRAETATAPQRPLVVVQSAEPPGLDPSLHREGPTYNVTINIFDSLLRKTPDGRNVPALAESFEREGDRAWVFRLRQGVTFHNGEPLTAEAVKFSIDRIFDPALESRRGNDLRWMRNVQVIDDLTIRIEAEEPFALAEHYFSELQIIPPQHIAEVGNEAFNAAPVGTGPFRFVRWDRGNRIVLERNDNYWRTAIEIPELEFRFIDSASSRVATLLAGEADLIADPPITARTQIEQNPNTVFATATGTRVMFVGLDAVQESPVSDPRVRRAMNYAIDNDAIVSSLLFGLAEATTAHLTPADFGYTSAVSPFPYDPTRARALLAEAGYPNGFSVTMDITSGRYINDVAVAEAIAGYLETVGITVNIEVFEFGAFNGRLFGKQTSPMYLVGWGNPLFDAAYIWDFTARSGSLLRSIENPAIDTLLAQARTTTDQSVRERAFHQVKPLIREAAPSIFLYKQPVLFGMSNRLVWEPRSDEFLDMSYASFR
ncbi:MAG: hypothetical protein EA403_10230 [Spirochaetaceae bacterium]|nr:MAG: hypothetical protein EA403_10230 [Spirochaetaceae bacterium]